MPVATAPSLPNLAAPPVGNIEINAPAAMVTENEPTPDAGANNTPNSVANTAVGVPSAGDGNGGVTVSRGERERQIKLGLLLVRLGGAKETDVFGVRGLVVPPRDLLVIHRPEDDAEARRPFRWYDPISWFLSGPRPSPMRWSSTTAVSKLSQAVPQKVTTKSTVSVASGIDASSVAATVAAATTTAAASPKVKKKRPLPVVNMQPLKDDETLEPVVKEEREKLLKDEAAVHGVLDSIEEARYKYLVPSRILGCEAEVMSVLQCYIKSNAAARNIADAEESLLPTALPAAADVLQCGPVVALLKRCAEGMVASYSEADGGHP
ncbi:hypothetical protein TCSYLVIO_000846 [Trypanosoma cruzi]|uniref:Uncharacterized protein n=2 Tax=Trypanosoma cruzi TaxID=5693 RepID=V5D620_TRYCR|nr:hypothetical protein TCSYLVIO_000846 [Trypanosoma cruzi]ESS62926.1 hypothetical protein TCDM_09360 [Trypanosoma cruzi Dm28c]PBJ71564.1 hypothetical protein BCY84_16664 [Trypanosoma cruzi cruzi]PWU92988.1 hypothetical protein C4B63_34g106 [Trypanosoma cruzi]RNF14534.1 hypothetical protein TcG_07684 [Trypanosoma cruzi]